VWVAKEVRDGGRKGAILLHSSKQKRLSITMLQAPSLHTACRTTHRLLYKQLTHSHRRHLDALTCTSLCTNRCALHCACSKCDTDVY
jgi:hypothetical protein